MLKDPRILFVPVSGEFGMGEYARSLSIALAAQRQWPRAEIHFALSRKAPYAATVPFGATLLDSSPTFHSAAIARLIRSFGPTLVVFDNAGRTAQLRAARRHGARIVFISARSRQRRKAFRWRWMRLIEEHWIAYPQFIAGDLSWWERFKLARLGRPTVRYLDVILSRVDERESALTRMGLKPGGYVLIVPGGGTGHPGVQDAAQHFLAAANALAQTETAVFVGPVQRAGGAGSLGGAGSAAAPGARLRCVDSLPQAQLAQLMAGARLIVTNGGSTLLQAIACGRACIGVAIAKDQAARIARCVAAGVAVSAELSSQGILRAAEKLLRDEAARAALAQRASRLKLANGVEIALNALKHLAEKAAEPV